MKQLIQSYVDGKILFTDFYAKFHVPEWQLFGSAQKYHYNSRSEEGKLALSVALLLAEMTGEPSFNDGEFIRCTRALLETGKCDRWDDVGYEDEISRA